MNNLRFTNKIKVLLIILIMFSLLSINLTLTAKYPVNTRLREENSNIVEFPKVTSPAINIAIFSPENKTYSKPMSGYYPATFGFENDEIGTYPEEWEIQLASGTSLQVISELGGHKNVVEFYDNNGGDYPRMRNTIIPQSSGTVEFYMMTSNAYEGNVLYLTDTGYTAPAVNLRIRFDTIEVDNGGWQAILDPALDNTWYHIRVDFDCGLDTFDVYINGELKLSGGSFIHNVATIGGVVFNSGILATGHYMYIDAVGFSWDSGYTEGDNFNEGLLLSFDIGFTPDWLGYSLDMDTNKTILGNKTITAPKDGLHNIQVYGNDSLGTNYISEKRYFSIGYINITIVTPENKTYSKPMSGYYPATFGFENDEIGTYPKEWDVQLASGTSLQVISELGGHKNVVEFYDNNNGDYPRINTSINPQSSGTVEFYMRTSNAYEGNVLYLVDTGYTAPAVKLRIRFDTIEVDNGGWQTILDPALDNIWYHIRVDFDCGLDTFDVYIDGELKLSGGSFIHDVAVIGGIVFNSGILATGHYMYIDAVGSSSDPNYSIGDNTNEGILVSFDISFTPDWLGYSLDGQNNKTILGNTTIPLPDNGVHSIQIFGNDMLGKKYNSGIRYFSIDINPSLLSRIPGYNLYILLSLVSLIIFVILRRKKKNYRKNIFF